MRYPQEEKVSVWLRQHGGRNAKDLLDDEKGLFVWMFNPEIDKKIHLPSDLAVDVEPKWRWRICIS